MAPDKTFQCGTPQSATASYWYFANLQATVQQAMLSRARCDTHAYVHTEEEEEQEAAECAPVLVDTWVKPFPWKAFDLDVGSILAGVIMRILLIFAFITPFQVRPVPPTRAFTAPYRVAIWLPGGWIPSVLAPPLSYKVFAGDTLPYAQSCDRAPNHTRSLRATLAQFRACMRADADWACGRTTTHLRAASSPS